MPDADEFLDLRGVPCPANAARALVKIATMSAGESLEVLLDAGEPMENLPPAINGEGHSIVSQKPYDERSWSVLIRVAA